MAGTSPAMTTSIELRVTAIVACAAPSHCGSRAGPTSVACQCQSRHALHVAPASQRDPQAAVEPEFVDRRGGPDRLDAIESDARPLEAALLQDPARRRIGDARAGRERVVAEL